MTENQKLREALQAAIVLFGHKCHDDCTKLTWLERAKLALAMQTDVPETNFGKIREALLAYHRATTFNERLLASAKADEALALPTADHLPNAGKMINGLTQSETDASASVSGLTAAPVGEREAFEAWLGITPCGAAHDFGWAAWQARAALSAGDAVDAQRYRWLREQSDDDFAFAVVKNPHFDVYESPEELDAAIDAAMRKGQL